MKQKHRVTRSENSRKNDDWSPQEALKKWFELCEQAPQEVGDFFWMDVPCVEVKSWEEGEVKARKEQWNEKVKSWNGLQRKGLTCLGEDREEQAHERFKKQQEAWAKRGPIWGIMSWVERQDESMMPEIKMESNQNLKEAGRSWVRNVKRQSYWWFYDIKEGEMGLVERWVRLVVNRPASKMMGSIKELESKDLKSWIERESQAAWVRWNEQDKVNTLHALIEMIEAGQIWNATREEREVQNPKWKEALRGGKGVDFRWTKEDTLEYLNKQSQGWKIQFSGLEDWKAWTRKLNAKRFEALSLDQKESWKHWERHEYRMLQIQEVWQSNVQEVLDLRLSSNHGMDPWNVLPSLYRELLNEPKIYQSIQKILKPKIKESGMNPTTEDQLRSGMKNNWSPAKVGESVSPWIASSYEEFNDAVKWVSENWNETVFAMNLTRKEHLKAWWISSWKGLNERWVRYARKEHSRDNGASNWRKKIRKNKIDREDLEIELGGDRKIRYAKEYRDLYKKEWQINYVREKYKVLDYLWQEMKEQEWSDHEWESVIRVAVLNDGLEWVEAWGVKSTLRSDQWKRIRASVVEKIMKDDLDENKGGNDANNLIRTWCQIRGLEKGPEAQGIQWYWKHQKRESEHDSELEMECMIVALLHAAEAIIQQEYRDTARSSGWNLKHLLKKNENEDKLRGVWDFEGLENITKNWGKSQWERARLVWDRHFGGEKMDQKIKALDEIMRGSKGGLSEKEGISIHENEEWKEIRVLWRHWTSEMWINKFERARNPRLFEAVWTLAKEMNRWMEKKWLEIGMQEAQYERKCEVGVQKRARRL